MKIILLLFFTTLSFSAINTKVSKTTLSPEVKSLLIDFNSQENSTKYIKRLKARVLKLGPQAVPMLLKVIKSNKYTDQKRWMAIFSLGRIMGKKASPYIAKYTRHPNWMLRLAGLKTLLALEDSTRAPYFADALRDDSLIVRMQALENIRQLSLKEYAPNVWKMLFYKHNYTGDKGKRKRTRIISKVIRTVGDLRYQEARNGLIKLIQSDKYKDLSNDIDYALRKISGKQSPQDLLKKRKFWARQSIPNKA